MIIKASTITNLTDARYFAAQEVDYLGFNLEPDTPGFLDPIYMKAMREWVQGPKIVGEFANMPLAHIQEAAQFYGLDAVQIPLSIVPESHNIFGAVEVLAYLHLDLESIENSLPALQKAKDAVKYFVIDLDITDAKFAHRSHAEERYLHAMLSALPVLVNLPQMSPKAVLEFVGQLSPTGTEYLWRQRRARWRKIL